MTVIRSCAKYFRLLIACSVVAAAVLPDSAITQEQEAEQNSEGWELFRDLASGAIDRHEFEEAEEYIAKAEKEAGATLDTDNMAWVTIWDTRSNVYIGQLRFDDAEKLLLKAIVFSIRAEGPNTPTLAALYNNLATVYQKAGRLDEAVTLSTRAVEVSAKAFAPGSYQLTIGEMNLARFYLEQARYQEAELILSRITTMLSGGRNAYSGLAAEAFLSLGLVVQYQGRHEQALQLFNGAIAIFEKLNATEEAWLVVPLVSAGTAYHFLGQIREAQDYYQRALALVQQYSGEDDAYGAQILDNLSLLHGQTWRTERGIEQAERALATHKLNSGNKHPAVAQGLHVLSLAYASVGNYEEAQNYLARAIEMNQAFFPPGHPQRALLLASLARLYAEQGLVEEALGPAREATAIYLANPSTIGEVTLVGWPEGLRTYGEIIAAHSSYAIKAAENNEAMRDQFLAEAFLLSQQVYTEFTHASRTTIESRLRNRDGEMAELLKNLAKARIERHQIRSDWLTEAVERKGRLKKKDAEIMAVQLGELDSEVMRLDDEFQTRFPGYAALVRQEPVSIANLQEKLRPGELLIKYMLHNRKVHVWTLTRDSVAVEVLHTNEVELSAHAKAIYDHMVFEENEHLFATNFYPFESGYWLYQILLEPALEKHSETEHIIIVPHGVLMRLTFGVLLTDDWIPASRDVEELRSAPWLAREFALTIVPSPAALLAVRNIDRPYPDTNKYLGIGSAGSDNLKKIAVAFDAPEPRTLGSNRIVKSFFRIADLSKFNIVTFSSPVPYGEFYDRPDFATAQPAILLTNPRNRFAEREYTEATEIPGFGMRPDWLIVNCPVMIRGYGYFEDISILARAFLFNGTRSLLMAYYPIDVDTIAHIAGTLSAELVADPTLYRAEAMRRAFNALIDDTTVAESSDPRRWGALILMGEGGPMSAPHRQSARLID